MTFHSILLEKSENNVQKEAPEAPIFFSDLNLDQIIHAITAGMKEYDLKPFFYFPLNEIDAVTYRHEIFQDLENRSLFKCIKSFIQQMRTMREYLAQANKLHYKYQKERWFLDAVEIYCDSIGLLLDDLSREGIRSRGFLAFREYLAKYAESNRFTSLLTNTKKLKTDP